MSDWKEDLKVDTSEQQKQKAIEMLESNFFRILRAHYDIIIKSLFKKHAMQVCNNKVFGEYGEIKHQDSESDFLHIDEKTVNSELERDYKINLDEMLEIVFNYCRVENKELYETLKQQITKKLKTGNYVFSLDDNQDIKMQLNKVELIQRLAQQQENEKARKSIEKY